MKIIIDIPDRIHYGIEKGITVNGSRASQIVLDAVKDGTPLSKGHGRLIDADELVQDIKDDSQLCYFNSNSERIIHDKMVDFAIDRITDASTIISAESEKTE